MTEYTLNRCLLLLKGSISKKYSIASRITDSYVPSFIDCASYPSPMSTMSMPFPSAAVCRTVTKPSSGCSSSNGGSGFCMPSYGPYVSSRKVRMSSMSDFAGLRTTRPFLSRRSMLSTELFGKVARRLEINDHRGLYFPMI